MYVVHVVVIFVLFGKIQATERTFYAIAHMVNTEEIASWAISSGTNALEIDLQFNEKTGDVTNVHHGFPCDCTCYMNMFGGSVCDFNGVCSGVTPHQKVMSAIMNDKNIGNVALIYIDSKIVPLSRKVLPSAGEKVVDMIEREFFSKGFKGKVLIGTGHKIYLDAVVDRATRSAWMNQIYITYDMFDTTVQAIKTMVKLEYPNKIFSIGLTACSPNQYYWDTTLGAVNKAKGLLSDVFAWTVDSQVSWEEYYIAGARGIITNFLHNMLTWVAKKGLKLAKPGEVKSINDMIIPLHYKSNEQRPILDIGTCDCEYKSGGCRIYTPAPKYSSCRCVYDGAWQCSGQVVGCDSIKTKECIEPDKSIISCVQGGGDCGGYHNKKISCDCGYSMGGCSVYDPAPPGYACKCSFDEFWMCSGSITKCRDPHSKFCNKPDKSLFSCLQGKGDCGGYTDYTCECAYGSGGCVINKAAPNNTACQCSYRGAWICSGIITTCINDDAETCKKPDMSISSCIEGSGECGAYTEDCECEVQNNGGCKVTKPAPRNTACRCTYYDFPYYDCYAKVVPCGIYHSTKCHDPDISIDSCLQGGGNCAGYQKDRDVDYIN